MEKRTIGSFIAVLRKANGLTQKQLAEKLCVSDKAVSRWERDECAPDLTLIPVIADIFSVTTDELLRGQRKNACADEPAGGENKSLLQTMRILKSTKTKYQTNSILCFGIALLGFLVALVFNFGLLRGPLGFIVGCVCTAASSVLYVIFSIEAKASIEDTEIEPQLVNECKTTLSKAFSCTVTAIIILFAMTIPLAMVYDTYMGITFESWLIYGLIFAVIAGILCAVLFCFLQLHLSNNNVLPLEENKKQRIQFRLRYTGVTAIIIVITVIVQIILNAFLPNLIMTGTTFTSWDSFKAFMETPVAESWYSGDDLFMTENLDGDITVYPTETITDERGNILCEYIQRNQSVYMITFNFENSTDGLPVTVYTDQDVRDANVLMDDLVNPIFFLSYGATIIAALIIYRLKVKKST